MISYKLKAEVLALHSFIMPPGILDNYTCCFVFVQVFVGALPKNCEPAQNSGHLPYVFKGIAPASAKKQQYIFDELLCVGEHLVQAS